MDAVGTVEGIFDAVTWRVWRRVGDEGPMVAVDEKVGIGRSVTVRLDLINIEFPRLGRNGEDDESSGFAVENLLAREKGLPPGAVVDQGVRPGIAGERVLGVDAPCAVVDRKWRKGIGSRSGHEGNEEYEPEHGGILIPRCGARI